MSYFNEEQQGHMRMLARLTASEKCACGWSMRGDCFGSCYGDEEKGGAERHTAGCPVANIPLTGGTLGPCICGATDRNVERSHQRRRARRHDTTREG